MLKSVPGLIITNLQAAVDGRDYFDTMYEFYSYIANDDLKAGDNISLTYNGEKTLCLSPLFGEEKYGGYFLGFRITRSTSDDDALYVRMEKDGHVLHIRVGLTEEKQIEFEVKPDYRDLPESLPFYAHSLWSDFRQIASWWHANS